MQVDIIRNVTDFTSIYGDLVSQHAWSGYLNGVGPVVIIVAESISKVQNRFLRNVGSVFCNIKVSRFHSTLGDRVRHEIEIELSVNDFGVLNEGLIDIGALRWVGNALSLFLEKSLSDSLVHDNQGNIRHSELALWSTVNTIFFDAKILELL